MVFAKSTVSQYVESVVKYFLFNVTLVNLRYAYKVTSVQDFAIIPASIYNTQSTA